MCEPNAWDAYIQQLLQGGLITEAAICGLDGRQYANSPGLCVSSDQVKTLAGPASVMNQCGPTVGTMKCMLVKDDRENEQSFCLHLKGNKAAGLQTVCVGKSKTALIIAVGPPSASIANDVFNTTKYLRDNNC